MQSFLSYIGMLILPGSVLVFIHGIVECRKTLAFVYLSFTTTGKIVEIKEEYEGAKRLYRPVAEFCLNKKHKFKFEAAATRYEPDCKLGETVGIRYLPDNPKIARINTFNQVWGNGMSAVFTGAVFTAAALFLLGKF